MNLMKKEYIHQLDSLRGIAALAIVFLHFSTNLFPAIGNFLSNVNTHQRLYLFVDLFFVLSGYVLTHNYQQRIIKDLRHHYFPFMIKRFFRIYPLHLFTLAYLVILHWAIKPSFSHITPDPFEILRNKFTLLTNVFLIHSSGLGDGGCYNCTSWNYPSWSISVEFLSYFLLPFMIILVQRYPKILMSLLMLMLFGLFQLELHIGHLDVASWQGWYRCLTMMLFGVILYRFHGKREFNKRTLSIAMIFLPVFLQWINLDWIVAIYMGVLVWVSANIKQSMFLQQRYLVGLGKISFSVYLLHVPVQDTMSFLYRVFSDRPIQDLGTHWQILGFSLAMLGVLILGQLSYKLIEYRLTNFLNNCYDQRLPK
jgi:peptidoglycan/LPS O-acetylase OafA/YrhL